MQIFDLHNDTFTKLYDLKTDLTDSRLAINTDGMNVFERSVCQFAVWLSGKEENPAHRYSEVLKKGKSELKVSGIDLCLTRNDLVKNASNSALLSLEGGAVIDSTERIEQLYCDGIRTVSLTWNYDNHLAGGAMEDGGLTDLGKSVIKSINAYRMALDLSHLNRKSFFEALQLAEFPIATHTGLSFLVSHKRNLTREQVSALAQKCGVVGLCFYRDFIAHTSVLQGFLSAVGNLLMSGFENNIAIGSDFDGAEMSSLPQNLAETKIIYENCIKLFGQTVSDKLFFNNSYNFYVNVLTNDEK